MQIEIWKPVPGYEGKYEVSNLGRVKSLSRFVLGKGKGLYPVKERILRQCVIKGYYEVILCLNGKVHKHSRVHRLVALAFIPNTDKKPNIDHINCNPLDNRVENLKWCTQKENCNNPISRERNALSKSGEKNPLYGRRNEQVHNSRKVACYSKEGTLIKIYPSIVEAYRQTNIRPSAIGDCASKRKKFDKRDGKYYTTKSAGGYIWKYVNS
jgi:hypothetical protein